MSDTDDTLVPGEVAADAPVSLRRKTIPKPTVFFWQGVATLIAISLLFAACFGMAALWMFIVGRV